MISLSTVYVLIRCFRPTTHSTSYSLLHYDPNDILRLANVFAIQHTRTYMWQVIILLKFHINMH
jgi:hypothetical protein